MAPHMCGDVFKIFPPNGTCPPNITVVDQTQLFFSRKSQFEIVCELYLISVLCLTGLFGNILSIVVLRNDSLRKDALFLLQALAVVDGLYVLVAFFRYPLEYMMPDVNLWTEMQPYVFPLLKTLQTTTIWMMVLVTTDRYIYVCWPLHAQRLFNHTKRKCMAVVVFIVSLLYNAPRFLENCIWRSYDVCTKVTTSRMGYTHTFSSTLYYDIYKYGLYLILLYICPLVILCYMNFRLIQAIQHSRRYPRSRSYQERENYSDNNATLVLVIIVLVFVICQTPELVLKVLILVYRYTRSKPIQLPLWINALQKYLNVMSEVMMVLNSSINFFIYVAFGRRFRFVMKETFKYFAYSNSTMMTRETVPLQQQNPPNNGGVNFVHH